MPIIMGQEMDKRETYGYTPGQQVAPIRPRMHDEFDTEPARISLGGNMNAAGCLFAPFAATVALVLKWLDLERTRVQERTEYARIHADLQSSIREADNRLISELRQVEAGMSPSSMTKYDLGHTTGQRSEAIPEPDRPPTVSMAGVQQQRNGGSIYDIPLNNNGWEEDN